MILTLGGKGDSNVNPLSLKLPYSADCEVKASLAADFIVSFAQTVKAYLNIVDVKPFQLCRLAPAY